MRLAVADCLLAAEGMAAGKLALAEVPQEVSVVVEVPGLQLMERLVADVVAPMRVLQVERPLMAQESRRIAVHLVG